MDYTQNYHLPQWEKTDRIMMEDFNRAMENIEGGIQTVQKAAEAAQATANQSLAALPYATGTYIGNGTSNSIDIGFKPRFLIITVQEQSSLAGAIGGLYAAGQGNLASVISFYATGFTVKNSGNAFPNLSITDKRYHYIAFR